MADDTWSEPLPGDVKLRPEDRGKPMHEITDFHVWDGQKWVHSSALHKLINVQVSS